MGDPLRIAALETATFQGSVAIMDGERVVEEDADLRGEGAVAALQRLLASQMLSPREIDAIAVSVGPGSFTGVRIGVAAAQGFAMGTNCRAVPVGTLEALAESVLLTEWGIPGALILPLVDARRGEVYASLYRVPEVSGEPVLHWGPGIVSCSRTQELLREILPGGAKVEVGVLCGDGAQLLAQEFVAGSGWAAPAALSRTRAGAVARVASRKLAQGHWTTAEDLQPVYLRKSDAEIAREKRQSPR
jgi:tRNA threonylcarbamoyladenosine biosynthesis protein TsaB